MELRDILSIEKRMEELNDKDELRKAMEVVLDLITRIAGYICEHTSTGQLSTGLLKKKIREFRKEFAGAKEAIDRGIDIKILYEVHKPGMCLRYTLCTWSYDNYRAGDLSSTSAPC